MAVRVPLKLDGSNLKEMSSSEIDTVKQMLKAHFGYQLHQNKTFLNYLVVAATNSGATFLGNISDTRKRSGASSTSTTGYVAETTTEEPTTVTTNWNMLSWTDNTANATDPGDSSNWQYPLYQSNGNIYAMSKTDALDTFVHPAIDEWVAATNAPGQYDVSTSNAGRTGYTLTSSSVIFRDTRADTASYTAANIGTSGTYQDHSTTIFNYYLWHQDISSTLPSYTYPVFLTASGNITQQQNNLPQNGGGIGRLQQLMLWSATAEANYKVRWRWSTSGSGTNLGTGMTDTALDGTGLYTTSFVNADDYRSQEFPDGTAQTVNTYYLRCYKAA